MAITCNYKLTVKPTSPANILGMSDSKRLVCNVYYICKTYRTTIVSTYRRRARAPAHAAAPQRGEEQVVHDRRSPRRPTHQAVGNRSIIHEGRNETMHARDGAVLAGHDPCCLLGASG